MPALTPAVGVTRRSMSPGLFSDDLVRAAEGDLALSVVEDGVDVRPDNGRLRPKHPGDGLLIVAQDLHPPVGADDGRPGIGANAGLRIEPCLG